MCLIPARMTSGALVDAFVPPVSRRLAWGAPLVTLSLRPFTGLITWVCQAT